MEAGDGFWAYSALYSDEMDQKAHFNLPDTVLFNSSVMDKYIMSNRHGMVVRKVGSRGGAQAEGCEGDKAEERLFSIERQHFSVSLHDVPAIIEATSSHKLIDMLCQQVRIFTARLASFDFAASKARLQDIGISTSSICDTSICVSSPI